MIDLKRKELPRFLIVGGSSYLIKTDYRVWLEFGEVIRGETVRLSDITFIFEEDIPEDDFFPAALEFYRSENATPKMTDEEQAHSVPVFDMFLDGEYIYASFMQAYHIDIIEEDMHYHKFKALLMSLPSDTKLGQIMQLRSYNPAETRRKYELVQQELKNAWALPIDEEPKQDFLEQMNDMFYNS